MNTINWNTYKFHCSGLSNLMTASRKKDELLSETAKTYLKEVYIKEVFSREKSDSVANKFMQKGIECETDSLILAEKVTGNKYFKNQKTLENEYIIGTPDVIEPELLDIKTSWDIFTFSAIDESKATKEYSYQLLGYMYLTGKRKARLIYCLVNTPSLMIENDMYRLSFNLPEDQIDKYRKNYIYDDIPEKMRVKLYTIEYNEENVVVLIEKIKAARTYLSSLSL